MNISIFFFSFRHLCVVMGIWKNKYWDKWEIPKMKCIWFVSFPVLFFTEGCFCSIGQANITGGITFYPTIYWIRKRMKWYGKCFRYNSRWWKNKQQEHKILIQAKNQRPHKAVSSPSPPALSLFIPSPLPLCCLGFQSGSCLGPQLGSGPCLEPSFPWHPQG